MEKKKGGITDRFNNWFSMDSGSEIPVLV